MLLAERIARQRDTGNGLLNFAARKLSLPAKNHAGGDLDVWRPMLERYSFEREWSDAIAQIVQDGDVRRRMLSRICLPHHYFWMEEKTAARRISLRIEDDAYKDDLNFMACLRPAFAARGFPLGAARFEALLRREELGFAPGGDFRADLDRPRKLAARDRVVEGRSRNSEELQHHRQPNKGGRWKRFKLLEGVQGFLRVASTSTRMTVISFGTERVQFRKVAYSNT